MSTLLGTLARCAVWLIRREQKRDKRHRDNHGCMCEPCQWVREVEAAADPHLGTGWR